MEDGTPLVERFTFAPANIRDMLQRSVDRAVDDGISLAFARRDLDARFFGSFPANSVTMKNPDGKRYFVIGASPVKCAFVAAP